MGKKTILLIRHGQYHAAEKGMPERLTALGRWQAKRVGRRLREYKISRIVHSSMPRAHETAAIIKKELKFRGALQPCEKLHECVPGFPAALRKMDGPTATKNLKRQIAQAEAAFRKYFKASRRDSVEVLVCHGNIIRYLLCRVLGIESLNWVKMDILQCSVSTVALGTKRAHRRMLLGFNDVGHIPKSRQTHL
jgi:serine/threonine-protein phosphatase PGAM5